MSEAILLTGGSGQLGAALQALDWPAGFDLVAPARAELDLADPRGVEAWLAGRHFAAILNAGAYTAVDKAESEAATAWLVNAATPAALAARAAALGVPILQISTDYVFDGTKTSPYVESDAVAPLGVYGASKLGGEIAVRASGARHVVMRTSWVVSAHGANFIKTMLRLAETRPNLRVVDDQRGAPTAAADLALTAQTILLRLIGDAQAPTGVVHMSNAGETTWRRFAEHIFAVAARHGRTAPGVEAITTAEYPTPARRPLNSRLDLTRLDRDFGLAPRRWEEATEEIVAALTRQSSS
ncbi:MAG: dTDP-4-dehydrorhamnose reductase [Methylobacteriaceae bacterium]|nr:dTDP-4-dehydrorhamnose reductase [Methylobacteriaceae bacterium]